MPGSQEDGIMVGMLEPQKLHENRTRKKMCLVHLLGCEMCMQIDFTKMLHVVYLTRATAALTSLTPPLSEAQRFTAMVLAQDSFRLQRSFRNTAVAANAVGAELAATDLLDAEGVSILTQSSDDGRGPAAGGGADGGAGGVGAAAGAVGRSKFCVGADATHAFWEVLSYPHLLQDDGIERAFLRALVQVMF